MLHSLSYTANRITVSGIKNVISIYEKEAELEIENGRVVICGTQLAPQKLEIEDGTIILNCETLLSVTYGGMRKKFTFKKLFK